MNEERRIAGPVEVRERDGKPVLVGYAAVFDQLSNDLGGFVERIQRGAFAGAIKGDVRALWQHDSLYVLGRTTNGTLQLAEDDKGLLVEITPPDTQWARDALTSIQRGDVSQMSFGFNVPKGSDTWKREGKVSVRTLTVVDPLHDVSPVTFPAYPQTSVDIRAIEEGLRAHPLSEDDDAADYGMSDEEWRALFQLKLSIREREI